ncbi:hypothetical protein MMC25_006854 [Agyrium rufum]|nr:hypothetical protein [Agyrium rufum]
MNQTSSRPRTATTKPTTTTATSAGKGKRKADSLPSSRPTSRSSTHSHGKLPTSPSRNQQRRPTTPATDSRLSGVQQKKKSSPSPRSSAGANRTSTPTPAGLTTTTNALPAATKDVADGATAGHPVDPHVRPTNTITTVDEKRGIGAANDVAMTIPMPAMPKRGSSKYADAPTGEEPPSSTHLSSTTTTKSSSAQRRGKLPLPIPIPRSSFLLTNPQPSTPSSSLTKTTALATPSHSSTPTASTHPSHPSGPVLVKSYTPPPSNVSTPTIAFANANMPSQRTRSSKNSSKSSLGHAAAADAEKQEIPPLAAFSFAEILNSIQPSIQPSLDSIAEICAKSKMSLANEYASHLPPHHSGQFPATESEAMAQQQQGLSLLFGFHGQQQQQQQHHQPSPLSQGHVLEPVEEGTSSVAQSLSSGGVAGQITTSGELSAKASTEEWGYSSGTGASEASALSKDVAGDERGSLGLLRAGTSGARDSGRRRVSGAMPVVGVLDGEVKEYYAGAGAAAPKQNDAASRKEKSDLGQAQAEDRAKTPKPGDILTSSSRSNSTPSTFSTTAKQERRRGAERSSTSTVPVSRRKESSTSALPAWLSRWQGAGVAGTSPRRVAVGGGNATEALQGCLRS